MEYGSYPRFRLVYSLFNEVKLYVIESFGEYWMMNLK